MPLYKIPSGWPNAVELETRSFYPVDLELRQRRQGGGVLSGSFPYNSLGTVRDRGRVRKERISSHAFSYAVNDPDRRIELLRGHNFDQPLASRTAGTLELEDKDHSLNFRAEIPPASERPAYMEDALKMVRQGLLPGISPGFTIPPATAVRVAERLIPEPGSPGVMIREVAEAVLYELSLVTRPVYRAADVQLRQDRPGQPGSVDRSYLLWL